MKTSIQAARAFKAAKQKGFTLVELLLVIGIIAVLVVFGTPFVRGVLIEGRVDPSSQDITKISNALRTTFNASGSATPYSTITSGNAATTLAAAARGRANALTIGGTAAAPTVLHQLGGSTGNTVTLASNTLTTAGDSFALTVGDVNDSACPNLAVQLARTAEVISINGTTVKASGGTFNGAAAQGACTTGDANDYVFVFR